MSGAIKRVICMIVCAVVLCPLLTADKVSGTEEEFCCFSAGNGKFYILKKQPDCFELECCDGNGNRIRSVRESVEAQELIFFENDVYVLCRFDGSAGIFRLFTSNDNMVIAENVSPRNGCTAVYGGRIYITDSSDEKQIRIYDDINDGYESIRTAQKIEALFVSDSGKLTAMFSDGVFDVESGRKTICCVPEQPFVRNGGIFCDCRGEVYRFSDENGFKRLCGTGCGNTVYCHGDIYVSEGTRLLRLDLDGNITAEYCNLPENAGAVFASGDSLAISCNGKIVPVDRKAFVPLTEQKQGSEFISEPDKTPESGRVSVPDKEVESASEPEKEQSGELKDEEISETGRNESSAAESSANGREKQDSSDNSRENSREYSKGIMSSEYEISGGFIFDVPEGTTAAMLKKTLVYNGELSFRNYREKSLSSGRIGTGAEVLLYEGGELMDIYIIVVTGDLTGEGNINTLDLRAMVKQLNGEIHLEEADYCAADVNCDGFVDLRDLYILHRRVCE